jgi:hypothetical protein
VETGTTAARLKLGCPASANAPGLAAWAASDFARPLPSDEIVASEPWLAELRHRCRVPELIGWPARRPRGGPNRSHFAARLRHTTAHFGRRRPRTNSRSWWGPSNHRCRVFRPAGGCPKITSGTEACAVRVGVLWSEATGGFVLPCPGRSGFVPAGPFDAGLTRPGQRMHQISSRGHDTTPSGLTVAETAESMRSAEGGSATCSDSIRHLRETARPWLVRFSPAGSTRGPAPFRNRRRPSTEERGLRGGPRPAGPGESGRSAGAPHLERWRTISHSRVVPLASGHR